MITIDLDTPESEDWLLDLHAWAADQPLTKAGDDPTAAAFLLIRARNDKGKWRYLLQKRNDGTWGLPGGGLHPGEDPWEGAIRETTEELGSLPDGLTPRLTLVRDVGKSYNLDMVKVGTEGYAIAESLKEEAYLHELRGIHGEWVTGSEARALVPGKYDAWVMYYPDRAETARGTPAEMVADYATTHFAKINGILRQNFGSPPPQGRMKKIIAGIDEATAKSELPRGIQVHRGIQDGSAAFGNAWRPDSSMVGLSWVDYGYGSTTDSHKIAAGFANGMGVRLDEDLASPSPDSPRETVLNLNVPAGTHAIVLDRGTAPKDLARDMQREVVLDRGLTYTVTEDNIATKGPDDFRELQVTVSPAFAKQSLAAIVKIGKEGYIHGYICVRPPCGDKKPASHNKDSGKVTHPDEGHIGTVSRTSAGVYTATHRDSSGNEIKLGGRYSSPEDAAQAVSIYHNITKMHQSLEDPQRPLATAESHAQDALRFAKKQMEDGVLYSRKDAISGLSAAQIQIQGAGRPDLEQNIKDTGMALKDLKEAPKTPKPARPGKPVAKPGTQAVLQPINSLSGMTRPPTRREAISKMKEGVKGFPAQRVDKLPWAETPFNVLTGEGSSDPDFDDDSDDDSVAVVVNQYMDLGTHDALSAQLREGGDLGPLSSMVKQLDDLIGSNSLTEDTTLYRGMSANPDLLKKITTGAEFTDKAYVSTASKPVSAIDYATLRSYSEGANEALKTGEFPILMKISAPAGTHAALGDPTANEVILPRNTKFHVDSIDSRGVVNVSVIPNE